jgi:hypothetical protein
MIFVRLDITSSPSQISTQREESMIGGFNKGQKIYAQSLAKSASLFSALPRKDEAPLLRPKKLPEVEEPTNEWDAIPAFLRQAKK